MINFTWYEFSELSVQQLYDVLQLRSEIFVVDQRSIYLDPDGRDKHAIHLLGMDAGNIAAYLRLFPPADIENYIVFGRVVTAKSARGKGYGKKLLEEMLAYCDMHYSGIEIQCSAQFYLKKFYESFGFKAHGEVYDEDGIPHIAMTRGL